MAAGSAIQQQQIQFAMNQARPSAVLSTDAVLRPEQVAQLRQQWNEQAKGLEAGCGPGGTPILTAGLKVQPWSTPGKDAQVAEMMKMSDEKIALAFRVPLQILGIGGTPYSSTELLMQHGSPAASDFVSIIWNSHLDRFFNLRGSPGRILRIRYLGIAALGVQGSHRRLCSIGARRHPCAQRGARGVRARAKRARRRA